MIVDVRADGVPLDHTARIAIVGAGPAGMVLARELADVAHVLVIESGGFENDADQQALLVGECAGLDYPLTETRARQFGGSSALWAGYCALFDAHDYSYRSWVPMSGWPFGIEALEPYYRKSADLLNLGAPEFDARDVARRAGVALPFDDASVVPTIWRFGTPTKRFGESLRQEFESSSRVTTLIHANVVDLRLDAAHGEVTELVIRTLGGREGRVSADLFVLACGGLETPRLLLNANTQVGHGVGNSCDMVGRCFMEHPHRAITPLAMHEHSALEGWTRRASFGGGREFMPCLGLSPQAQAKARILNARAHVYRTPGMRRDEPPKVGLFMEQAPNPRSRVLLSDSTDALGMKRIRLDWRLTELDWRTFETTACALARAFERIGAASMRAPIDPAAREREPALHSNHHLGTTRMSVNCEEGVVDSDCRVHDHGNLYIAGGAVFPTVSWANPTFTLMALTFRLAAHLRDKLRAAEGRVCAQQLPGRTAPAAASTNATPGTSQRRSSLPASTVTKR